MQELNDLDTKKLNDLYNSIENNLKRNGYETKKVKKAFLRACQLHNGQKRNDGTPVIFHPLSVALILAENYFDEDVVCAGLLHDTVEDCKPYNLDSIKDEFGQTVANYVDAVTEIDKNQVNIDEKSIENLYISKKFLSSIDEDTYKKLIRMGKMYPEAFFVKFADRIHNLRTISTFSLTKQVEKVKETEEWVLPVAIILKTTVFFRELKNECFKIVNNKLYDDFFYIYNDNYICTKRNADVLIKLLNKHIFQTDKNSRVILDRVKEYEVFDILKKNYSMKNLYNMSEYQINMIPTYNIFVTESKIEKGEKFNFLFDMKLSNSIRVIGMNHDTLTNEPYIIVRDNSKVLYNIYHMTHNEYLRYCYGDKENLQWINTENTHDIATEYIDVMKRDGEYIRVPKDSTVLDFAFTISRDLGLSFDYAIVTHEDSDKPQKLKKHKPDYKLKTGDKVTIYYKTDEYGNYVYCPEISWLAFVNTETAKTTLIKYFQNLYEKSFL